MPIPYRFINSTSGQAQNKAQVRKDVRSYVARVSAAVPDRQKHRSKSRRRQRNVVVFDVELGNLEDQQPPAKKESTLSSPSLPPPQNPLDGHILGSPIQTTPFYHLPYANLVLYNYFSLMAGPHPELDGPHPVSQSRHVWMPKVFWDELLFSVVTLFAASFYAIYQRKDLYESFYAHHIHHLRGQAIAAMIVASRAGAVTDELIGATAKMASWEAIYGTIESYYMYMIAVSRMVKCRGGLDQLGLDGYLARMLLFIDNNSSFLLNTPQLLQETMFPRRQPFAPNPDKFRVICGLAGAEPSMEQPAGSEAQPPSLPPDLPAQVSLPQMLMPSPLKHADSSDSSANSSGFSMADSSDTSYSFSAGSSTWEELTVNDGSSRAKDKSKSLMPQGN